MDNTTTLPPVQKIAPVEAPALLNTISIGYNPRQILLDMYNLETGRNYDLSRWDFKNPIKQTNGSLRNTLIVLFNSVSNENLYGARGVFYNRIHTSALGTITAQKGNNTLVSEVLAQINSQFGIRIGIQDIVDEALPAADTNGNVSFTLNFSANSLQFYSGPIITLAGDIPPVVTITKTDIGLGNVDNTADIVKPVSTPQEQAIANAIAIAESYALQEISNLVINSTGIDGLVLDGANF